MITILLIDLITVGGLAIIALSRGLEAALPFATFMIVLAPTSAFLPVAVFGLTTQRIIVIVLALFYLLLGANKAEAAEKVGTPLKVLMMIHVGWCLVSTANSIVLLMSIKKMLSVILEYYLLYVIYLKTVTKVETIHKILAAMVFGVMTCSVFGAVEAYRGWSVMTLFPKVMHRFGGDAVLMLGGERGLRIHSTFAHAILFGAGLVMAILLALYLPNVLRRRTVLLWCGLLLMFLNLFKTVSRGPWLGAVIGCALLFVLGRNRIHIRVLMIAMLSIAVCLIRPGVYGTIKTISLNTFDDNTSTGAAYVYRYALQDAAIQKLSESGNRALWGFGLESFYYLKIEGEFFGKPKVFDSADNAYVDLMIETGYVGLLIIVLLLLKPAWVAWKQFRNFPGPDKYLGLVFFVNFVVYYFEMYSVAMYSWGQNGLMLWIMIALTYAFSRCKELEAHASEGEALPERAFSPEPLQTVSQSP